MARDAQYIEQVRGLNKQIWEGIHALIALQAEWNALDYGSTLDATSVTDDGIDRSEVGAVVFDTANAFKTVLDTGHATNMAKLL